MQVATRHTGGRCHAFGRSSPAPTSHPHYKVGDCDPSITLALDRLVVQGAVNVVSIWWADEDRRRRGGRSRRANAGTHTYHLCARTCTHHQLPSRHPTPAAVAIYTGQGLHTSSGNAVSTTTTYGPPPHHLLTVLRITSAHPPPPLTCEPHCPSPVPAFKSALSRLQFPKCRHDNKKPNSSGSRRHRTTTDLTPTTGTPSTSTQVPTPPAPSQPPPSYTSGTHGQRPGSSPGR